MSLRGVPWGRRREIGSHGRVHPRSWLRFPGERLRQIALQGLRSAGAAILESDCPCCRQSMGWGRYGVCEACWHEVAPSPAVGCDICDRPLPATDGAGPAAWRCGACDEAGRPFVRLAAYGRYAGRIRDLIHALKYDGRTRLARPMGDLLAEALISAGLRDRAHDSVIVPVPLAPSRLAERGYNQSLLLARALRRAPLFRRAAPGGEGDAGDPPPEEARGGRRGPRMAAALIKTVETPPQAGRTRAERLRASLGAYAPARGARGMVAGRGVVLVDDVFTTGATAGECARVLAAAGAAEVIVAVVARTPEIEGTADGRRDGNG